MYQRTFWVETSGRSVAAALGPWLLTDARGVAARNCAKYLPQMIDRAF